MRSTRRNRGRARRSAGISPLPGLGSSFSVLPHLLAFFLGGDLQNAGQKPVVGSSAFRDGFRTEQRRPGQHADLAVLCQRAPHRIDMPGLEKPDRSIHSRPEIKIIRIEPQLLSVTNDEGGIELPLYGLDYSCVGSPLRITRPGYCIAVPFLPAHQRCEPAQLLPALLCIAKYRNIVNIIIVLLLSQVAAAPLSA